MSTLLRVIISIVLTSLIMVEDKNLVRRLSNLRIGSEDGPEQSLEEILAATSALQQKAAEIRSAKCAWPMYHKSNMIGADDLKVMLALESDGRDEIIKTQRLQVTETLLSLMTRISKDQSVQYLLVVVDDLLNEDKGRVEMFVEHAKKSKRPACTPFLALLSRNDSFIQNMSARIVAKIACWSSERLLDRDLVYYLGWLRDQLRVQGNEHLQSLARCLQMMLRIEEYRKAFVEMDGISTIVYVLGSKVNFQIQYQLTFCLWTLSFTPPLAEAMARFNVVPVLADIFGESVKEKVTRIILATLRNLIEKPEDASVSRENAITMFQCKVLKQLEILQQSGQKFEDPDLVADMEFLTQKLQESVQDLSSFDEYANEVRSGRLEWSPVHASDRFWRENAHRLNEKNYELLKILVRLLESSQDPLVLSVAAHDLGEYVRHYSRGKVIAENLGGKHLVMQKLAHEDPDVRYNALLCVQKLMVQHWEYLGRQLKQDTKNA